VALTKEAKEREVVKMRGLNEVDLDQLLMQPELDSLEDRFWARYRQTWPPDVAPSDLLVSRISRELSKRMLSVRDITKVKTQGHQQRATTKRIRLSEGIEMVTDAQDDPAVVTTPAAFLAKLYTLLLAYSKAGVIGCTGAPVFESKSECSTKFVQVPLDVVMRYYFMVSDRAARGTPLAWLMSQDSREREAWVDKFRNSTCTLGEAILTVLQQREAMWEMPARTDARGYAFPSNQPSGKGTRAAARTPSAGKGGKAKGAEKGTGRGQGKERRPCTHFNRGSCKTRQCRFLHKCNKVLSNGRVCGGSHPASRCSGA
jgi:hypothetical protein